MGYLKVYAGDPWHADESEDSVRIFCGSLQIIKAPKISDVFEPYWPDADVLCWILDILNAASPQNRQFVNEAITSLQVCQTSNDTEAAHFEADEIICNLLEKMGLGNIVTEYQKVDKWYA